MKDLEQLVVRFLRGECNSQEEESLLEWLNEDVANRRFFALMREIWLASSLRSSGHAQMTEEELSRFKEKIASATDDSPIPSTDVPLNPKSVVVRRKAFAPYAIAAGMLAAGMVLYWSLLQKTSETVTSVALEHAQPADSTVSSTIFETKLGSIASITLPDGSRVRLNSGSKLSYRTDFGLPCRRVELEGEAYFDVEANEDRPFVIMARGLKFAALGTSFNIQAYPDSRLVTAALETGNLSIDGASGDGDVISIRLAPKHMVMIRTGESTGKSEYLSLREREALEWMKKNEVGIVRFKDIRTEIYTSWKDERWIVDHETLGSLCGKLSRRYDVTIDFQDAQAPTYRFTGLFENETIEEIMHILRHTLPIKYRMEKRRVVISSDVSRIHSYTLNP